MKGHDFGLHFPHEPKFRNYLEQYQEHQEQRHIDNTERRHSLTVGATHEQHDNHHPDPQLEHYVLDHFAQPIERLGLVLFRRAHVGCGRVHAHLNRSGQMGESGRLLLNFALVKVLAHRHPEDAGEKGFQENGLAGICGVAYESDLGHVDSLHL